MMQSTQHINNPNENMRNEIQRTILESDISIDLQPIVSLKSNDVIGYKVYPKGPAGTALESTSNLVSIAQDYELSDELEYATLTQALGIQHELPQGHLLSINIGSNLFLSSLFREITNLCQHIAPYILFELTEHIPFVELAFVEKRIKEVQDMGYHIALNNTESVFSGYERAKKLKPSMIKFCYSTFKRMTDSSIKLDKFKETFNDLNANNIQLQITDITEQAQVSELLTLGFTLGQWKSSMK
jgi:EAL domain-containing protein (putative c-di-GMP-specific phosphodiesterase class I)